MCKKARLLLVFLAVVMFAISACAPATPPTTPTTALPTTAPTAVSPLTLSFGVPSEITNIDPAISTDWPGGIALRFLYDPLLRIQGDPVTVVPWIAQSYDVSTDGTKYTFHLRSDVVFHDGTPLTADAVAYSFDRLIALKSGFAWMFDGLMDTPAVTVVDPQTIRFNLKRPFAPFPGTMGRLFIVNPVVVKAHEVNGDWGSAWMVDHEAGSGPTTISRWEPGTMYEFQAVPNYWAGWPHKEKSASIFRYRVMRETGPARLALEAGELDWIMQITEEDAKELEGKGGFVIEPRPLINLAAIWLNTASQGPTGDPNVRKALSYAFDHSAFATTTFDYSPGESFLGAGLPGLVKSPELETTDLALAKEYLAKSKWPNGDFTLDFVSVAGFLASERAGLILIDSLSKLNIKVNAAPKTWSEITAVCSNENTVPDSIVITTGAAYPEPYAFLYPSYGPIGSASWNNCHNYTHDQQIADLLDQATKESDETKRMQIYANIQKILVDVQPGILLGTMGNHEAHSAAWKTDGFTPMFAWIGYPQDYYKP